MDLVRKENISPDATIRIQEELKQVVRFGENEQEVFLFRPEDKRRVGLFEDLKKSPTNPESWWKLLQCPPTFSARHYSLLRLYRRATTIIPRELYRYNESYIRIWIEYAKLHTGVKDTRDTFRYMKSEKIGEKSPIFHKEYALFEWNSGCKDEAKAILERARKQMVISDNDIKYILQEINKNTENQSHEKHSSTISRVEIKDSVSKGEMNKTEASKGIATPRAIANHSNIKAPVDSKTPSQSSNGSNNNQIYTPRNYTSSSSNSNSAPRAKPDWIKQENTSIRRPMTTTRKNNRPSRLLAIGGGALRVPKAPTEEENIPTESNNSDKLVLKDTSPYNSEADKSKALPKGLDYIKNWNPNRSNEKHNNVKIDNQSKVVHADSVKKSSTLSSTSEILKNMKDPENVNTTASNPFYNLIQEKNLLCIQGATYLKLAEIGRGGSCKVYRILGPDLRIYALKKIKLKNLDRSTIAQYENEIRLLKRLQGSKHIIRLIAAEADVQKRLIYVIMEHGEIDLNHKLTELRAENDNIGENFIRIMWEQMLQAVESIHKERIIHGDLKPANFLFVNGALKLIDFGIAKAIANDTTNIYQDSLVGTFNYMSPEAIDRFRYEKCMKVNRASDIWSLGCILYQMIYGRPPFADINNLSLKIHAITDPKHEVHYPSIANQDIIRTMKACLQRNPENRATIDGPNGLLNHSFLKPVFCNPTVIKSVVHQVVKKISSSNGSTDDKDMDALVKSIQESIDTSI